MFPQIGKRNAPSRFPYYPLLVLTLLISGGARVSLATSFTFTNFDDPGGILGTNAFGINASGQIVGRYIDGSGGTHSFL